MKYSVILLLCTTKLKPYAFKLEPITNKPIPNNIQLKPCIYKLEPRIMKLILNDIQYKLHISNLETYHTKLKPYTIKFDSYIIKMMHFISKMMPSTKLENLIELIGKINEIIMISVYINSIK